MNSPSDEGRKILQLFDQNPKAFKQFLKAKDEAKILVILKVKGERAHVFYISTNRKAEKDCRPEEIAEIDCDE